MQYRASASISVAELVELLKKNPGKYNYGSIGNGSLSHLAMEAIALKSGTTMVHIPYPGSPQAMTAVLRNDVQMACLPAIAVTPHVASGQVKILAISLGRRSALLPDYPTLKEAGIDVEADAWNGLIAPAQDARSRSSRRSRAWSRTRSASRRSARNWRPSSWSRSRPRRRNSAPRSTPISRAGRR